MVVISILRLLGLKLNVQSDLITLIDDAAMALRHPADVKTNNARNGRKVLLCVSDYLIRCVGVGGIGPKELRRAKTFVILLVFFAGRGKSEIRYDSFALRHLRKLTLAV